tara:strand:- start:378 stop:602 length:225 start_codon:yes stop_codon:yes gene_type:complete
MPNKSVILYKSSINSKVEVLVVYPDHPSYELMKENIFNSKKSVSIPELNRIIIDGKNLSSKQLLTLERKEIENF